MKKVSKILCFLLIILMVSFSASTKVLAADVVDFDGDEYEEVTTTDNTNTNNNNNTNTTQEDNKNKTTENTNKETNTQENKDEEKTTNNADQSTKSHAVAGSFTNTIYAVAGFAAIAAIVIGYIKFKKYNY